MLHKMMKIGELERLSGVDRSTLHFYRNSGLLPPPIVHGPRLHLYGEPHLRRLRELRELQSRGMSLAEIRAQLAKRAEASPRERPQRAERHTGEATRGRLLDEAAQLFVAHGYESVHMSDVARAAGVGKATLYQAFSSKAELFVACLDRVTAAAMSSDLRSVVHDAPGRNDEERRAAAMISLFGFYRMMILALGSALSSKDTMIKERAKDAFYRMAANAAPALRRAVDEGRCRAIDPEMLAYMTWGALIAVGARLAHDDGRYSPEEALRIYIDFVNHGTAPPAAQRPRSPDA